MDGATTPPPGTTSIALDTTSKIVLGLTAVAAIAFFLPWAGNGWFEDSGEGSTSTLEITSQMMWDTTPASLSGSPLIIPLAILAVVAVFGVLRRIRPLVLVGTGGIVLIGLLFINGLRAIDSEFDLPGSALSTTGVGAWIAIVAAAAAFVTALRRP
jgi:hypothetical protein